MVRYGFATLTWTVPRASSVAVGPLGGTDQLAAGGSVVTGAGADSTKLFVCDFTLALGFDSGRRDPGRGRLRAIRSLSQAVSHAWTAERRAIAAFARCSGSRASSTFPLNAITASWQSLAISRACADAAVQFSLDLPALRARKILRCSGLWVGLH
jgi:hypothetical protein